MTDTRYCKLEVFIPESHLKKLQSVLRDADAGHIGNYDSCLSCSKVMSTWRPLFGTNPYIGEIGEVTEAEEVKVEVTVSTACVNDIIRKIKEIHPYEEPVINVIPLLEVGI